MDFELCQASTRCVRERSFANCRFTVELTDGGVSVPKYVFHLHDGPDVPMKSEMVLAPDDEEARDLAGLRLTLSRSYTHVEVERDGQEIFRLKRDSQTDRTPAP